MRAQVAVIGAGAFGAWTAWHLRRAGRSVLLLDAYGPANSRASSGGESRIIRMGYGAREVYTRWSIESMAFWQALAARTDQALLERCGALWLAPAGDTYAAGTLAVFARCGVDHEVLAADQLRERFPFTVRDSETAVFEPTAGALLARRSIQTLVKELVREGARYEQRRVEVDRGTVRTHLGERIQAEDYVFACGPWLPWVFPDVVGHRIVPSRQEVLFFGARGGEDRFLPRRMPCWIDVGSQYYGLPDLENRGFKLANDRRGPPLHPDTEQRTVTPAAVDAARQYLATRLPVLAGAPLVETRVCQYENTATADYILDRHPQYPQIWIAGGGSGHGFKHGPSVGRYLSDWLLGQGAADARFSLAGKTEFTQTTHHSSL